MIPGNCRILFFVMALPLCFSSSAQQNKKPNIILIYTDDLGYGDVSCNG
jgi:hypothetical protein